MRPTIFRLASTLLTAFILGTTSFACAKSPAEGKAPDTVVITDIAAWKHPIKEVLAKNKVQLSKVELAKNRQYPILYVTFPYDPQSSQTTDYFNQLYTEILAANGWWSYALHDEQDQIQIEINWDKSKRLMSTDIVPLQPLATEKK